jgi:large subunit ribosomal protein L29
MKANEIHEFNDTDLAVKLTDARAELFNLRFQHATGQLDNPTKITAVKRDIARLHTEMRARELEAAKKAAAS